MLTASRSGECPTYLRSEHGTSGSAVWIVPTIALVLFASAWTNVAAQGSGQLPSEVIRYADLVVHNGRVHMDDEGINSKPGTIAEPMAVRDGKVLAAGRSAEMLRLSGPKTQRIDAKERTVILDIINVYSHVHDGAVESWIHGECRQA